MENFIPRTPNRVAAAIIVISLAAAIGIAFGQTPPTMDVEPDEVLYQGLLAQLVFMAVIAVFVERANETFLIATGLHDDRVIDELTNTEYRYLPIGPYALTAGAVLSAALAAAGVRLLEPVIGYSEQVSLIAAVDVVLTTGLLAGGSTLLHSVINLIPTFSGRVSDLIKGIPATGRVAKTKVLLESREALEKARESIANRAILSASSPQHTIRIERGAGSSGTLYLTNASTSLQFPVVWDPDNRISPATLPRCSRTTMATKQRPGIHMPGATLHGSPNNEIFIHRGRGESWSDGCFILDDDDMASLLAAIPEENAFNITVQVI